MENGRVFLVATLAVVCICISADIFSVVEAKFSLSTLKGEIFSGIQHLPTSTIHSRNLGEFDPCAKYGDGHSLPAGHPCASSFEGVGVIPRLIGVLKKGGKGGKHPPGVGKRPPGEGKHPPGVGRHPPGVGKRPPRGAGDPRCRRNVSTCLDPARNTFLAEDPTAITCCRTKCISLQNSQKNCGVCGNRCRSSKGGTTCCSAKCVDLTSDPLNCGGCGVKCSGLETCVAGICVAYGV